MKFAVHLFTAVRVKITGVEAETPTQAIEIAEGRIDLHDLLDNKSIEASLYSLGDGMTVESAEYAEEAPSCYLVDTLLANGEVDDNNATWLGDDLQPLVDGKTTTERKAERNTAAETFMEELQKSVETLTGIAEQHGARTLADLMYLMSAIQTDGHIYADSQFSAVEKIVTALPSGTRWASYMRS